MLGEIDEKMPNNQNWLTEVSGSIEVSRKKASQALGAKLFEGKVVRRQTCLKAKLPEGDLV